MLMQVFAMHELEGGTNLWVNAGGDSSLSLESVMVAAGYDDWQTGIVTQKYAYVPGLMPRESGDLIMLYMRRPTIWTWHADHPPVWQAVRRRAKWMVLGTGLGSVGDPEEQDVSPETGCLLDTAQFTDLLKRTLIHVQQNNRPYWTNVVREHTAFLELLSEAD
jgi:hypothetical protein